MIKHHAATTVTADSSNVLLGHSEEASTSCGEQAARGSRRKAGPRAFSRKAAPPGLTGGAKWQVSVDWLTIVVPGCNARRLIAAVREFLGKDEPCAGGCFQPSGVTWESSAKLFFDPRGQGLGVLQLNSRSLAILQERCEWREFYKSLAPLCARITRLDIALDLFRLKSDLISKAVASCHAGELCGARVFEEVTSNVLGTLRGRTLYCGKRGKEGSGRYLRIYDKGLEQKAASAGQWVRWEIELTAERACSFAHSVLEVADLDRCLVAEALGSMQFREVTGAAHLDRRPLVPWFRDLVAATSRSLSRTRVKRRPSEYESWRRWIREAVVPGLRSVALRTGLSLPSFLDAIACDVQAKLGVRYATLALEFERREEAIALLDAALTYTSIGQKGH